MVKGFHVERLYNHPMLCSHGWDCKKKIEILNSIRDAQSLRINRVLREQKVTFFADYLAEKIGHAYWRNAPSNVRKDMRILLA